VAVLLTAGMVYGAPSTSVEVEIGDEIVTFDVPEDYAKLKANYLDLIDVYAESEQRNITLTDSIDMLTNYSTEAFESGAAVQRHMDDLYDDFTEYVRNRNKPIVYFGFLAGYNLLIASTDLNQLLTLGPAISINGQKTVWQVGLPLSIGLPPRFEFGIGILSTILFNSK
jgi:hypothetical protein